MGVANPAEWLQNVEALYQRQDAAAISDLHTAEAQTRFGSRILRPAEVHAHPAEWFAALSHYDSRRSLLAAVGDLVISESAARYVTNDDGTEHQEFGLDIFWVNDSGKIYHKHHYEVLEPFQPGAREFAEAVCRAHQSSRE